MTVPTNPVELASFQGFCREEWIGREAEWLGTLTILHWTLSCLGGDDAARVLIINPGSRHYAENLRRQVSGGEVEEIGSSESEDVLLADAPTPVEGVTDELSRETANSTDAILAVESFIGSNDPRRDTDLLRGCHRALRPGGSLLAKLRVRDGRGHPSSAGYLQFVDLAARAGFEEREVIGCQGIATHFKPEFWRALRGQGEAAFDAVINGLAQINDDPAAQWMSPDVLYIGVKR